MKKIAQKKPYTAQKARNRHDPVTDQERTFVEDVEATVYAIERIQKFEFIWQRMGKEHPRYEEFRAFRQAALNRATDLVLDTFAGYIHGKRYWPPPKMKKAAK